MAYLITKEVRTMEAQVLTKGHAETIKRNLDVLNQPVVDVEVVIVEALQKLSRFVENRYKKKS